MKVIDIKATRGPNYWSVRRRDLIVMLLDLEEMEEQPTNLIPGFYERIVAGMPSLQQHRCSEGTQGGFFKRVQEGTWLGHVIEHIALELQSLAGMNTGFGRTREAGRKGLYHVVFDYEEPECGKYAALAAVKIAEALVHDRLFDLQHDVNVLISLSHKYKLGPSTHAIVQEAINNAIRHAQASSIAVHLMATEGAVTIDVIDDGLGLGNAHRSSGGGIENMKTRARLISARFAIKAAAVSGGTLVSVSLPAKELSAKGAAA